MIEESRKKIIEERTKSICDFKIKIEKGSVVLRDDILELLQPFIDKPSQENFYIMAGALSSCLYSISSLFFTENTIDEAFEALEEALIEKIVPALNKITPCGNCIECMNGNFDDCENPNIDYSYTTSAHITLLANRLLDYDAYIKMVSNPLTEIVESTEEVEYAYDTITKQLKEMMDHD